MSQSKVFNPAEAIARARRDIHETPRWKLCAAIRMRLEKAEERTAHRNAEIIQLRPQKPTMQYQRKATNMTSKAKTVVISREQSTLAPAFQGDTLVWRKQELPANATKVTGPESNIVAHSETGHHHIVTGGDVFRVPDDNLSLYVKATSKDVSFQHLRDWDTHNTLQFKAEIGDIFKIRNQREMTPDGWLRVQD